MEWKLNSQSKLTSYAPLRDFKNGKTRRTSSQATTA
jgi:hypothetical protein